MKDISISSTNFKTLSETNNYNLPFFPTTQCYFYFINIKVWHDCGFFQFFLQNLILFTYSVLTSICSNKNYFVLFNRKIRKMIISQICLKLDFKSAHVWNPQFLANFGILYYQIKKILKLLKYLHSEYQDGWLTSIVWFFKWRLLNSWGMKNRKLIHSIAKTSFFRKFKVYKCKNKKFRGFL